LFFQAQLLLESQRLPRSAALWVIILHTSDYKAGRLFLTDQGGGKRLQNSAVRSDCRHHIRHGQAVQIVRLERRNQ